MSAAAAVFHSAICLGAPICLREIIGLPMARSVGPRGVSLSEEFNSIALIGIGSAFVGGRPSIEGGCVASNHFFNVAGEHGRVLCVEWSGISCGRSDVSVSSCIAVWWR